MWTLFVKKEEEKIRALGLGERGKNNTKNSTSRSLKAIGFESSHKPYLSSNVKTFQPVFW